MSNDTNTKPINDQILDFLNNHGFSIEEDNDGQIVIYTGLTMYEDSESPSGYSVKPY